MGRRTMRAFACGAVAWMLMLAVPALAHAASAPGCDVDRCGLRADGAYPDYVIGTLVHVGSDADVRRVFAWAKAHGYWTALPNAITPYLADVKLVTIALPPALAREPVAVFVTREEFAVAPYRVGDLVRYSPHGADHEIPPKPDADDAALFRGLTGCVAVLCRAGDRACARRYVAGVFSKADGRQIDLATGKLMRDGLRIDPVSLLPVNPPIHPKVQGSSR